MYIVIFFSAALWCLATAKLQKKTHISEKTPQKRYFFSKNRVVCNMRKRCEQMLKQRVSSIVLSATTSEVIASI